jgi:hypothetical protein
MWESDFKVSKWHKFLSQESDLYKEGLTEGEETPKKPTQATSNNTSSALPRRVPSYKTGGHSPASAPTATPATNPTPIQLHQLQIPVQALCLGGIQGNDSSGFQPSINYVSEERRDQAPLTVEECKEINLIKRLLNPNRKISSHDDDIVAVVASLKPDDINKTQNC